jgi:hypothetical protein
MFIISKIQTYRGFFDWFFLLFLEYLSIQVISDWKVIAYVEPILLSSFSKTLYMFVASLVTGHVCPGNKQRSGTHLSTCIFRCDKNACSMASGLRSLLVWKH